MLEVVRGNMSFIQMRVWEIIKISCLILILRSARDT